MTTVARPRAIDPADHPAACLAAAIGGGQLEIAAECFARDACLLTPDATAVRGRESIRAVLAQLIARGTRIEVLEQGAIGANGVEVASQRWRITSPGAEGKPFSQSTRALMVAVHVEQRWKLAVAAPWGWAGREL